MGRFLHLEIKTEIDIKSLFINPEYCPLQKFWYSISKFVCKIQNLDKKYEKNCKGHYDKYPLNASRNIQTIWVSIY